MVKNNNYLFLFLSLILISCSSLTKKDQDKVQELFLKKEYDNSLEYIEKSKVYSEKKNLILKDIEEAKLLFQKQMYYQSSEIFREIITRVEEKYTKSITKEAFVLITNDNNADFIPDYYEQSFVYLYQAMNFIMIWQNGFIQTADQKKKIIKEQLESKDRAQYLSKARAMMLAWDTFNKNIRRTFDFKSPLLSEIALNQFAAKVHILFNDKKEASIAIDLLIESFKKLTMAKKDNLLLDYNYDDALTEVSSQIEILARKYRSWKIKEYSKKFNFKKDNKKIPLPKTTLFVEYKAKMKLVSTPFSYTLNAAIDSMEEGGTKSALKAIGVPLLTYFATGTLGLGYMHRTGNTYIHVGSTPLDNLAGEIGIEFYLPTYVYEKRNSQLKYLVKQKDSEEIVFEKIVTPFAPLDIISLQMNKEKIRSNFNKHGVRIGTKYVAAIIAAYTTYKTLNSKDNPFASTFALGQYVLSSKAIRESEQADIRYWVTLPRDLYTVDLDLPKGDYILEVYSYTDDSWSKVEYKAPVNISGDYGNIIPLHF